MRRTFLIGLPTLSRMLTRRSGWVTNWSGDQTGWLTCSWFIAQRRRRINPSLRDAHEG